MRSAGSRWKMRLRCIALRCSLVGGGQVVPGFGFDSECAGASGDAVLGSCDTAGRRFGKVDRGAEAASAALGMWVTVVIGCYVTGRCCRVLVSGRAGASPKDFVHNTFT